jgi:hypothetical protein
MLINKKAQVMTYDFFIAMSIFLLILTIAMGYWYYSMIQMQEIREKNQAANQLFLTSDVWFRKGYPNYWAVSDVRELGMDDDNNRINQTKLSMLSQLGYSKIISLLSLGAYNFQYTIYNSSSTIFQFPSSVDLSSAKNLYKIERIGILNESIVRVRTIIWD